MTKVISKKDDRKNRKAVFGFVALFAAVAIIVGVGYAYFSDVITGDGTATAGSLDITGDIADQEESNWNPGDNIAAGVSGTCDDPETATTEADCTGTWTGAIANNGTKSAWIRETLTVNSIDNSGVGDATADLSGWVYACIGNAEHADLITAFQDKTANPRDTAADGEYYGQVTADTVTVGTTTCTKLTTADLPITIAPTSLSAPNDVISGSIEKDGAAETWSPSGANQVSLFFDPYAPNSAQLGSIDYTVAVQALQYRNNTTDPTTNGGWATVTSSEFAL